MAFQGFRSPTLPAPPEEYEEPYFMALIRSLGAYFDLHDSKAGLQVDSIISDFIQLPSTAANRIFTNTGSDVVTTGTGIVSLIYSVTDSRWILLSVLA